MTSSSSKQTLPLHLISAQNQQKIVQAQNLPVKQQLPLKLASKLSNQSAGVPQNMPNQGSNISHSVVHRNQLLPLRLSQGTPSSQNNNNERRYSGNTNMSTQGYQRLVDNDVSLKIWIIKI